MAIKYTTKNKLTRTWNAPIKESVVFKQSNNLVEAKEDQEKFKNWLLQYGDGNEEVLLPYFDLFLNLKNNIKSPYNDFYYWMKNSTQKDFLEYIIELKNAREEKKQVKQKEKDGARLVYSDDQWKVYEITTYEASAKYGKGTKWCITGSKRWANGEHGSEYFDRYYNQSGIRFYYFINANGEKYALAVYPDNEHCEIYNAEDVKVAFIPNAPKIDEIKVTYDDNSDRNILINAIMSGQLDEQLLLQLMEEVIYDNSVPFVTIINNPETFVSFLDENIPDGYLEYEAVTNGDMSEEEYEAITGEVYDDSWGGDMPNISWDYDETGSLQYKSKKDLLNPNNFKDCKYFFCVDNEIGYGIEISKVKDYVQLYMMASDMCGIDNWDDVDIANFYDGEHRGASRADIFGIMMANQLIADIKDGVVPKSAISNIGLSNEYLSKLPECLHEDLDGDIELVSKSFGTSSEPFKGPSYILPNGKFLKIRNADINITQNGSGDRGMIIHLDVQKWLNRQNGKEVKWVDDIDLEEKCIRVNTDALEHYIVLPKNRPNKNQLDALTRWIDFFFANTSEDLRLVSYYGPTTTFFRGSVAEDIIDEIKGYYARGMFFEDYSSNGDLFAYTLDDICERYPDIISDRYESCGNAFIMPDGRFLLTGERFSTHDDFAFQTIMDLEDKTEEEIENEWDTSKILNAFTEYFSLIRVNDGSVKDVEDRAYFVIPTGRMSQGQMTSLEDFINYILDNKYRQKIYTLQAFVSRAHKLWNLGEPITAEEIMKEVKRACIGGYFLESLKEDINKYYRIEIQDEFGDRAGLFTGSFELIPTRDTIEEYPEDFDWLTDEQRNRYYRIDEIINELAKIKSPGVDTDFNGLRDGDIFAYTPKTYGRFKTLIKELKGLVKQLGMDIIIKEVSVDDKNISYKDDDQVAYSKSDKEDELNEYLDEVGFEFGREEFPVYATDEAYRLKNLLAKGDKAYRIYYDKSTGIFFFQDAFGNRTHWDMIDIALKYGWLSNSDLRVNGDDGDITSGDICPEDYPGGYMVFIPFNYDKQLRWHTRLGDDDYFDARVYPFGVIFVRDSEAYSNPLFSALGEPDREIYYNYSEDKVTLNKDNQTWDLDVDGDLDYEPNNAISIDVTTIGKEKTQKDKNDLDYVEDMLKSLDFDIGGSGKYEEKEYINFANRFYDEYQLVKENLWTLKDEEGNIIKDSLDFNNLDSWDVISSLQNAKDDDLDDLDDLDLLDLDDLDYDDIEIESLNESKQDIEKFKQWAGEELANRFFSLKNRLKGSDSDIYYWMGLDKKYLKGYNNITDKDREFAHKQALQSLSDYLDEIEKEPTNSQVRKQGKEDAKTIYEDKNWLVLDILSYEASVLYGKDTTWCVTGNNGPEGRNAFDMHTNTARMIFYIPKKGSPSYRHGKYALEFEGINNWLLYNDADFIEVGEGRLLDDMGGLDGADTWNPFDTGGVHPDFPHVDGLPDINKAYEELAKVYGYDKPLVLEDVNEYQKLKALANKYGAELKSISWNKFEIMIDSRDLDSYNKCFDELQELGFNLIEKKADGLVVKLHNEINEKIVKKGNKWQVQSEKGKNLGTYDTKKEAEKRLQQVHYFKHVNESTGFPISVLTYQNPNVLKHIKEGNTYIASYDRGMFQDYGEYNPYRKLAEVLGLKNCPIFGALNEEELRSMLEASGIDYDENGIIKLEVPSNEVHYMGFYDWTDYIYALEDQEGFENESGMTLQELEDRLHDYHDEGYCQVVIDRIEPDWIVDKFEFEEKLNKWNYKTIGNEIVSNLQELSYWDDKGLDPYVDMEDWGEGCDINATYYGPNEEELECAWIQVRVYQDRQAITFRQIDVYDNSGFRNTGLGKALVERVLRALPKGTKILVHMDMSGGFWYHMAQTFKDYDWDKSLHEEVDKSLKDPVPFLQTRDACAAHCLCDHAAVGAVLR